MLKFFSNFLNLALGLLMITQKNKRNFQNAQKVIPGGVNSPVRAFKAVGAKPTALKALTGEFTKLLVQNQYLSKEQRDHTYMMPMAIGISTTAFPGDL
jgi:hypothetical protein